MNLEEFAARTAGMTIKPAVREAAKRVLVNGETWAASSAAMGVPESSIKRAIDRIMQKRCPCCGQRVRPTP